MKKKFFAALAAVVIGTGLFTGCEKDKPYNFLKECARKILLSCKIWFS